MPLDVISTPGTHTCTHNLNRFMCETTSYTTYSTCRLSQPLARNTQITDLIHVLKIHYINLSTKFAEFVVRIDPGTINDIYKDSTSNNDGSPSTRKTHQRAMMRVKPSLITNSYTLPITRTRTDDTCASKASWKHVAEVSTIFSVDATVSNCRCLVDPTDTRTEVLSQLKPSMYLFCR